MMTSDWSIFPVGLATILVLVMAVRRGDPWGITLVKLAAVWYGGAVAAVAFFPLPVQRELLEAERLHQFLSDNLVPFASITAALSHGWPVETRQLVANIAMFIPVGVLVPLLDSTSPLRRVVLVGALGAVAIEGGQFLVSLLLGFTYRITDIDDVILNVTGATIGFGLFSVAVPVLTRARALPTPQEPVRSCDS